MTQRYSKKRDALALLYRWCRYRKNLVFDNSEVGRVCRKIGFGNQFDVTKLDSSADLPATLVKDEIDFTLEHLGE